MFPILTFNCRQREMLADKSQRILALSTRAERVSCWEIIESVSASYWESIYRLFACFQLWESIRRLFNIIIMINKRIMIFNLTAHLFIVMPPPPPLSHTQTGNLDIQYITGIAQGTTSYWCGEGPHSLRLISGRIVYAPLGVYGGLGVATIMLTLEPLSTRLI